MSNEVALFVEIASAYDMLDWSGDNWPQPKPFLAAGRTIDWETVQLIGERPINSTDTQRAYYEHIIKPHVG